MNDSVKHCKLMFAYGDEIYLEVSGKLKKIKNSLWYINHYLEYDT